MAMVVMMFRMIFVHTRRWFFDILFFYAYAVKSGIGVQIQLLWFYIWQWIFMQFRLERIILTRNFKWLLMLQFDLSA